MREIFKFRLFALNIAILAMLNGCVVVPQQPTVPPTLDDLMAKANQVSNAGQPDQAIILWREGAVAYPADKAPWLKIAQTKYAANQYGEAIINAQEVLTRDPTDNIANSMIVVSGLRLATNALKDLSTQNNLSGSILIESQSLVKLLRESLGETVLVPVAPSPPPDSTKKPPPKKNKEVPNPFGGKK